MKKEKITPDDRVTLHPIFGIKPIRYIPILYFIILLLILFSLLILPGIIHNGSYVTISSQVPHAALWVDGVYRGEAGYSYFIQKGDHDIVVKKPYFSEADLGIVTVPGHLFGSLFTKKKVFLDAELSIADLKEYLSWRLQDVARWAPIKNYSETYFYPEIFQEVSQDIQSITDQSSPLIREFFQVSLGFITSDDMFQDYQRSLDLLQNGTRSYITSLNAYKLIVEKFSKQSISSLDTMIHTAPTHIEGPLYQTLHILDDTYLIIPDIDQILLGDTDGTALFTDLPYSMHLSSYGLSTTEITEKQYAAFVDENPYWNKNNKPSLIKEKLVDEGYLDQITLTDPTDKPIRSISYYAAMAFCDWKTARLHDKGLHYSVTLPTEAQWEAAAKLYNADDSYTDHLLIVDRPGKELFGMLGSLWEITSSPYLANHHILTYDDFNLADMKVTLPHAQIVVKGGSYVNSPVHSYARGASNAGSCSQYNGFRTLVKETK